VSSSLVQTEEHKSGGGGTSSAARPFWLLRLIFPGTRGRWLTGGVIFLSLLLVFIVFGDLFAADAGARQANDTAPGVVLFFCLILGYIVPIHHLIIERASSAYDQLSKALDVTEQQITHWRRRITHKSIRWVLFTLGFGAAAGIAHNLLLTAAAEPAADIASVPSILPMVTTLLVWLVMTAAIVSLIDTAMLFRELAGQVRINLLNVRALTPFGAVATSSTLAMIGAQAAFPAMMVESDVSYVTFVPGLIATGVPMVFVFLLPILPVHHRVVAAKRAELERVSAEIEILSPVEDESKPYDRLTPLLTYRREIAAIPEWPFDTSVVGRLAIYLIIPPLTWIGAALIEILVDAAL
jgi:hypothetical protein